MVNSINQNIFKNVAWISYANILSRIFTLVASIVTARLLTSGDFGIIAMAATFSTFIEFTSNMGVDAFIVSRLQLNKKEINTIFLFNMAVALALGIVLIISSQFAELIYKAPELKIILIFSGVSFFISTFSIIPKAILIKDMRQDIVAKLDIAKNLTISIMVIILAILGFKYLSYVIGFLAANLLVSTLYLIAVKWTFKFNVETSIIKDLFKYCRSFFGKSVIFYFISNSDYIIVGLLLGQHLLGYYYFSFEKAFLILIILYQVSNTVFFPVFSKVQNDSQKLWEVFNGIVKKQTFIVYPLFLLGIILAGDIFNFLFSSKWNEAILIFQVLMCITFSRNISVIIQTLLDATGKPEQNFKHNLIITPIFIGLFLLGTFTGGLLGVAISALLAQNISLFLLMLRASKVYQFSFIDLIGLYIKPFTPLIIQLPILLGIKYYLGSLSVHNILTISIISFTSLLLYLIITNLIMKDEYDTIITPLKSTLVAKVKLKFGGIG